MSALDIPTTALQSGAVVVTHPNTDDVLVTASGQTIFYDSGWRQLVAWNGSGVITAGAATWGTGWGHAAAGNLRVRRVNDRVMLYAKYALASSTNPAAPIFNEWTTLLPAAFRGDTYPITFTISAANGAVFGAGNLRMASGVCKIVSNQYISDMDIISTTSAALPTSLPGTLISPAPA